MDSWGGTVEFGPGQLRFSGRLGAAHRHHHAAVQVINAEGDTLTLSDGFGEAVACRSAVIPPGAEHEIAGSGEGSITFVDPTGRVGRSLVGRVSATNLPAGSVEAWQLAGERLTTTTPAFALGQIEEQSGVATIDFDEYEGPPMNPALLHATKLIPSMLEERVLLTEVALRVGISDSRLGHLFSEELGLPFSAFVRWARLQVAIAHVGDGKSLTEAAHSAGFSDSSHLTRVCHAMLGLAPSDLTGAVTW